MLNESINESRSDEAVCRTALATPGLSIKETPCFVNIMVNSNFIYATVSIMGGRVWSFAKTKH